MKKLKALKDSIDFVLKLVVYSLSINIMLNSHSIKEFCFAIIAMIIYTYIDGIPKLK